MPAPKPYTRLFKTFACGKYILPLLVVTLAVYGYMLLVTIPAVSGEADGLKILDMRPLGYSDTDVRQLFDALGQTGRSVYLSRQLPIDMVYPALFGLTFALLLGYFVRKRYSADSRLMWLTLLPLTAGLCDYLENIGIIILLKSYPDLSSGLIRLTGICSIGKSSLTTVFWLVLVVIMVASVRGRRQVGRDL